MNSQSRRQFLTTATLIAGAAPFASCSPPSQGAYDEAVAQTWDPRTVRRVTEPSVLQRELVRYATLAPSSHNTQCWHFQLERDRISIVPDLSRRCPAVDPDDHHLFVSLGCAAENLAVAAGAYGLRPDVRFDATGATAVHIDLSPAKPVDTPLFRALPHRQCSRSEYDGQPLAVAQLRQLAAAGEGVGVHVLLLTARDRIERVSEYVVAGNTVQMNDPAFMDELRNWIRFSNREAVAQRDGLFSGASGNPSVPRWLASPLFKLLFTPKTENEKYQKFIRSSAGIAVFVSDASDAAHWIETGRCYERFVLLATAMGIRTAMINQPVEVPSIRTQFAASLGIGDRRPDLVVRFGHGPPMPRSLRRPVDAVIVS